MCFQESAVPVGQSLCPDDPAHQLKAGEYGEQQRDPLGNPPSLEPCSQRALEMPFDTVAYDGGGAIVNTASIAGLIGLVTSSAYVAAKHGVIGLTKTAALEYADAKIRVNAVCPGFIKTQMTEETMRRRGEAIMAQIPLRRMGEPGEIAEMVVWLCSDRASYVTGASYNVDGGWMAV